MSGRPSRLLTKQEQIWEVYRIETMVPPEVEAQELRRHGVFTFGRTTPSSSFELLYVPPRRRVGW